MALEDISLPVDGGPSCPAVLAVPAIAPGKRAPGVVVLHDMTGMQPDIRRHCARFADAGYVAIAPDLFATGRFACIVRTVRSVFTNADRAGTPAPIAAARKLLAERPDVDAQRIAITGFCMGGGFALLAAADDAYAVAAPFYGPVPRSSARLRGICPTLAQFGEDDLIFRSHAARLSRHLSELGVEHEVLVLPGVGHSFMNDNHSPAFTFGRATPLRAAYHQETEERAWAAMLAFFDRHMVAQGC